MSSSLRLTVVVADATPDEAERIEAALHPVLGDLNGDEQDGDVRAIVVKEWLRDQTPESVELRAYPEEASREC